MKALHYFLFVFTLLFVSHLSNAQTAPKTSSSTGPFIKFESTEKDFGDIKEGTSVTHTFVFENTGIAPLTLQDVRVTCGCTASEWPRNAIMPGQKGEIKITFNSKGKIGLQNKVITVISNAENQQVPLKIRVNVL